MSSRPDIPRWDARHFPRKIFSIKVRASVQISQPHAPHRLAVNGMPCVSERCRATVGLGSELPPRAPRIGSAAIPVSCQGGNRDTPDTGIIPGTGDPSGAKLRCLGDKEMK